jgi:hypothetical protein
VGRGEGGREGGERGKRRGREGRRREEGEGRKRVKRGKDGACHLESCGCCFCRFESTIVGQFFGHTHQDSFKLFTDDDLRPTK